MSRKYDVPKCDLCEKPATRNVQKIWCVWRIRKDGSYAKVPDWTSLLGFEATGDENLHLCDKHFEQFRKGELEP